MGRLLSNFLRSLPIYLGTRRLYLHVRNILNVKMCVNRMLDQLGSLIMIIMIHLELYVISKALG